MDLIKRLTNDVQFVEKFRSCLLKGGRKRRRERIRD